MKMNISRWRNKPGSCELSCWIVDATYDITCGMMPGWVPDCSPTVVKDFPLAVIDLYTCLSHSLIYEDIYKIELINVTTTIR